MQVFGKGDINKTIARPVSLPMMVRCELSGKETIKDPTIIAKANKTPIHQSRDRCVPLFGMVVVDRKSNVEGESYATSGVLLLLRQSGNLCS